MVRFLSKTGKKWWALMMFVGIMLIHVLGILVFIRGFLLTRTELSEYSQCSDISQSPCNVTDEEGNTCWTKPAVDRLVIIVFDALRFDFVAPSSFFEEKKPWMDKFHVMHKLATQQGVSAQIFKAIADPPTTSLQRLKGLTTGGIPTFIDVGNSFGAPAIVEDNLIHQLVKNGKRVVMMGDDTWIQLFPDHFNASFPFPSFNVKDLDTVDNGCIDHLLPSLYRDDWDVLIAHFLGVDHAGHIFGVHSPSMIGKLEQYNGILERVVEAMVSQSGPGGSHENSLLLVMGDHGQTLNGDHGGGTSEEVETAMFALSLKKPTSYLPLEVDTSYCRSNVEGRNLCISSMQQLDFAVTVAALLGVPFPFGSLGQINPELYALATSVNSLGRSDEVNAQNILESEDWMQIYANALCVNSWQVKRYIDVYSDSSVIGFSDNDLRHISDLYVDANKIQDNASHSSLSKSKLQIDAYSKFLASVAGIARSKWTEFNLTMMLSGFAIMLGSIFSHIFLIRWLDKYDLHFSSCAGNPIISVEMIFAYIVVLMRSSSFLSNSFILEEGKVGSFLLATTAILQLRYAFMKKKMRMEAILFVLLIPIINFGIQLGQFKQAVNSLFLKVSDSWMLGINSESYIWINTVEVLPILALIILACLLCKGICQRSFLGIFKFVIIGTVLSYMLIAIYWALDSHLLNLHAVFGVIRGDVIPRVVYAVSLLQVLFLAIIHLFGSENAADWEENLVGKALAMLCSWSSTVILLSGKQGSVVAIGSLLGGWCIIKLMSMEVDSKNGTTVSASYSTHTIQWSLLAVCLFFCTGHWCAFDGLRYAAAFIGFDEFNLIRQAVLLAIETFGFSQILPIVGLPFLVAYQHRAVEKGTRRALHLCQVYLIYGLTLVIGVTFTILCVIFQRRHLMVWGLFAPKFVFDVAALLLADFLICFASFYYIV